MTTDRRVVFTAYPYDMCTADAELYDEDAEPDEMQHPECGAIARHRTDEVLAWLLEKESKKGLE